MKALAVCSSEVSNIYKALFKDVAIVISLNFVPLFSQCEIDEYKETSR